MARTHSVNESDGGDGIIHAYRQVRATYNFIKLIVGGIALIALGFWLLSDPTFRTDPRGFTFQDIWPALGAFVAGCFLMGLAVFIVIANIKK